MKKKFSTIAITEPVYKMLFDVRLGLERKEKTRLSMAEMIHRLLDHWNETRKNP